MSKKGGNIFQRKGMQETSHFIRFCGEDGRVKYGYISLCPHIDSKEQPDSRADWDRQRLCSAVSYSEILTAWLQAVKLNIKESTYARYSHLIERHIRPHLGAYRLCEITTQLVESFVRQQLQHGQLQSGGALAPKTVTDILTVVKRTVEYARYHDLQLPCNLSKVIVKRKEREMRVLNPAEQKALVKTLLEDTNSYKFGVLLSLYTGIRLGELCALRWENLDLSARLLKVRQTMQRIQNPHPCADASAKTKLIITEPKSACSLRDIPLPECVAKIGASFSGSPNAFVLTGSNTYVEPRTMQNYFKRYIRQSGIANANFHALRHTFATHCVEVGFELKSLSEILGHANVNITLNRYVHSSLAMKHSNMSKLSFPI